MMPKFNDGHQHCVIAGTTERFSVTHRVAVLPDSHVDDIFLRSHRAIALISGVCVCVCVCVRARARAYSCALPQGL
jgi:hypothetical protein